MFLKISENGQELYLLPFLDSHLCQMSRRTPEKNYFGNLANCLCFFPLASRVQEIADCPSRSSLTCNCHSKPVLTFCCWSWSDSSLLKPTILVLMSLRAILQESEARLEMGSFGPPSIFVWRWVAWGDKQKQPYLDWQMYRCHGNHT